MKLLDLIVETLENKKAQNITVIDFENTSPICDFFVICEAPSLRQINAIYQETAKKIVDMGFEIKHQPTTPDATWLIIDALDIVVHIFQSEERSHYNLEKLYMEYIRD